MRIKATRLSEDFAENIVENAAKIHCGEAQQTFFSGEAKFVMKEIDVA